MTKTVVSLDDKFRQDGGRVFMSAIQALVRLPLDQAKRDRAFGRRTSGFISGYRGSPLGGYDAALWSAKDLLAAHDIRFLPGLNEELAASSVRGAQELDWFGKSQFAGVFCLWYGKGVGVDRGMEALKLGNLEGAAANGGVLVLAGDDHGGKSSASAHQSDHTLIAAMIPILYPADPAEIIAFGLIGWEMSRFSGAYVGLKCVTDTLDFSSSTPLPDWSAAFVHPGPHSGDADLPRGGLGLRQGLGPLVQEDLLINRRLPAAQAFARANGVDRVILDSSRRSLSIVTAGKAYLDVRQALADLELGPGRCAELGIRLYKVGLVWPLEPIGLTAFAEGSGEVLVVEEKRPVLEDQIAAILFSHPADRRPALSGKRDPRGRALLSSIGELRPTAIRAAIVRRLIALGLADDPLLVRADAYDRVADRWKGLELSSLIRPPYFCSGCPHSTGTRLPEGSQAIGAVGCHGLAAYMPERRTMMPMPMGGDGMPWVAAGPLVDAPHIFQNVGDGTYAHSGVLSIRAAVAAGSRMTFKILYNDAVAMTGGQPVEGAPTPLDIVRQLLAERVSPVVVVTDQPENFTGPDRPPRGVRVFHRDQLDAVQRDLREAPGVSGLVYVQTCAAEKRRRRKRGDYPDPDRRVFINTQVCEGCGDCSAQSNCVSIQPVETEFGRKRVIDQSSCNKDFSCLKGFCPSFVTVEGARIAKPAGNEISRLQALCHDLPRPAVAGDGGVYGVLITGIGGTGVLTIGAVLGMAAHLEGKGCTVLDQTGMAQKGGAVTSHLRVAPSQDTLFSARLDLASADLILGCDMLVAAGGEVLRTIRPGLTRAVLNAEVAPTGAFQVDRDFDVHPDRLRTIIGDALGGSERAYLLNATGLAKDLTGDAIATNFLMVGYALQMGLLPVSLAALEEAIALNRTNAEGNLRTLNLGRLAAHRPDAFGGHGVGSGPPATPATLQGVISRRVDLLTAYQDGRYAARYSAFMAEIGRTAGTEAFLRAVAETLGRLMAYKDEYEVARLYTDGAFKASLARQFEGDIRLGFHLAPPLIAGTDAKTGRPRKMRFGGWALGLFGVLARMKRLRGTALDPFGYTRERRGERALIEEYQALIRDVAGRVTPGNLPAAVAVARAAGEIKGFGPVKAASVAAYRARMPGLLKALEGGGVSPTGTAAIPSSGPPRLAHEDRATVERI
jgi:indolepyruvate ferredoxin oxidoreductase